MLLVVIERSFFSQSGVDRIGIRIYFTVVRVVVDVRHRHRFSPVSENLLVAPPISQTAPVENGSRSATLVDRGPEPEVRTGFESATLTLREACTTLLPPRMHREAGTEDRR